MSNLEHTIEKFKEIGKKEYKNFSKDKINYEDTQEDNKKWRDTGRRLTYITRTSWTNWMIA